MQVAGRTLSRTWIRSGVMVRSTISSMPRRGRL
ncbi:hypothetical protein [Caudoviricetes sp.]|nr:hypothetical protein [Caudoviricetes sp.]